MMKTRLGSRRAATLVELSMVMVISCLLSGVGLGIVRSADGAYLRCSERLLLDELRLSQEKSLAVSGVNYGLSFDPHDPRAVWRIEKTGNQIKFIKRLPLAGRTRFSSLSTGRLTTFQSDRVYFTSGGSPSSAGTAQLVAGRLAARITVVPDTGRAQSVRVRN